MVEGKELGYIAEEEPTTDPRTELAHLLAEHYSLRDTEDFDQKTEELLPRYRTLQDRLKEKGEWLEEHDKIVHFLCDALSCSEEEAEKYIVFFDEVTQAE